MATLADFETKINTINANTTASAAAAKTLADNLAALKTQLDTALTNAGVPASDEAQILAQLDSAVGTSGQLATFLTNTASGTTEPPPVPAPAPVA